MSSGSEQPPSTYLTTREVAELIRVKERKVYDLAAAGEIPHRRITGKLLFPRDEIRAWLHGDVPEDSQQRPSVITGSHDPLLEWAIRESACGLATLFNGSSDGLDTWISGKAGACGLHLRENDDWNISRLDRANLHGAVLVNWAHRRRGLLLGESTRDKVTGIADLRGWRVARRQEGAGAQMLFEELLRRENISAEEILPVAGPAHTESDAAAAVVSGEADATLGIEAMARRFRLEFVPVIDEVFDLLIDRRTYFQPPMQALLDFTRTPNFTGKAEAMGGYDIADLGRVRWLSA
ncbi:MAG: helix-turn-helix transcriptional regulator [Geminicoccaceae bacterium]|nr:helix-turn-helix transcriptional regulator [Geminicoccaceae bacterium]